MSGNGPERQGATVSTITTPAWGRLGTKHLEETGLPSCVTFTG